MSKGSTSFPFGAADFYEYARIQENERVSAFRVRHSNGDHQIWYKDLPDSEKEVEAEISRGYWGGIERVYWERIRRDKEFRLFMLRDE